MIDDMTHAFDVDSPPMQSILLCFRATGVGRSKRDNQNQFVRL